jgi:hypothetical protein
MNTELKESGLASMFNISPITENLELAKFLGKKVQYKAELKGSEDFIIANGTLSLTAIFQINETQTNYRGIECLRGYDITRNDKFGRCIHPHQIELV